MSALELRELEVRFGDRVVVDGVSFAVEPGECVAIVGESGAGKSLTGRALIGLLPPGAKSRNEALVIAGTDARALSARSWRQLRGRGIALVSQDALSALDPLRRIGDEVREPLEIHRLDAGRRAQRVTELLESVWMPEPESRARAYPHELSGGLRQRALIASALAGRPAVLIADEATTALDSTVQARVLELLRSIADAGTAVIFISHDFAAVRQVADRVLVMQDGRIIEQGPVGEVLASPQHPHTRELVAASRPARTDRPARTPVEAVLTADRVSKSFDRPAVRDATFRVAAGRTLGIVGESGSGKTTLARLIVGVERPDSGSLIWAGRPRVQLVHQNPLAAFDPRWTIGRSLAEALEAAGVPKAQRRAEVNSLLNEVGLDPSLGARRPAALSGGQRQRAAIARALAARPDGLVLDEPVSALDPTVRSHVLALLDRLQQDRGLTMIFVSHDLAVIAAVCDDVLVMRGGDVVEQGTVSEVFADPRHPFTRELLAAAG